MCYCVEEHEREKEGNSDITSGEYWWWGMVEVVLRVKSTSFWSRLTQPASIENCLLTAISGDTLKVEAELPVNLREQCCQQVLLDFDLQLRASNMRDFLVLIVL